jgi:universal stress protein F
VTAHLPGDFHQKARLASETDLGVTADKFGLGDKCEIFVREGNPAAEILDFADDAEIDLIVMQSHDPGLADYLLGSTAARVVRHAHCSVLVFRPAKS